MALNRSALSRKCQYTAPRVTPAVSAHAVLDARREVTLQFLHALANRFRGGQRVAGGRQLHADAGGRLAVQAGRSRVVLSPQFDARDVAQMNCGAVSIGAQHDAAEFLHAGELAVDHHRGEDRLARQVGQIADRAGRDLGVLRADRRVHIGRGQVKSHEFGRIDPHAHRPFRAEQLRLANPGDALDLRQHVARRVVAQRDRIELGIVGRQDGEKEEIRARLVHAHPLLRHRLRQAGCRAGQPILHVHLRELRVGA
jgi:hypothetical protein